MKKVLMLCPRYVATISGVETYLEALMDYLSEKYEVHLITRAEKAIRKVNEKIHIHYVDGFNSLDINIYKALPQLKKIIKDISPDIVHIHCCMSLFLYNAVMLRGEYPLIVTMHSTPDGHTRLFGWFNDYETEIRFCRTLFGSSEINALIFGSQYYMEAYLTCAPEMKKAKKIYVNRYFSNLPEITIEEYKDKVSRRSMLNNRQIRILFPSRIIQRKGIEEALLILKRLPDCFVMDIPALGHIENNDYTKKIIDFFKMHDLLHRVYISEHVVFADEMIEYYRKADLVLIPSIYEGFGIVAVEAMNSCVPVFTTCAGGLSEIIDNNFNGIKITLDNLDLVADKIVDFIQNSKFQEQIVINAKYTITEKFTKERHMNYISKIYDEVLKCH